MWRILFFSVIFLTACVKTEVHEQANSSQAVEDNLKLALAYLSQNHLALAQEKLLIAAHLAPQDPQVLLTQAYFFQKTNRPILADKLYQQALKQAPGDSRVLNNYGAFLCQQGRVAEGITFLKKVQADPYYLYPEKLQANLRICERLLKGTE